MIMNIRSKNKKSLNQNLFNHKTFFEKLEDYFKKILFDVLFLLLQSQDVSMSVEIFFLSMELIQFLSFPLHPIVNKHTHLFLNLVTWCMEEEQIHWSCYRLGSILPNCSLPKRQTRTIPTFSLCFLFFCDFDSS